MLFVMNFVGNIRNMWRGFDIQFISVVIFIFHPQVVEWASLGDLSDVSEVYAPLTLNHTFVWEDFYFRFY